MKRSDIPVLDDLRAFEAVARLGSVRAAARELYLTHGAVSRRISKLSRTIGQDVTEPAGRGIRLTPAGQTLFQASGKAFGILQQALDEITAPSRNPPIVLSCERSVAMRWLIPRLSHFQDQNPDLTLSLSVGGGALDFTRDGITMAIRRLDFPLDPEWQVRHLSAEETGPVLPPDRMASFKDGNFVGLASRTRPRAWDDWQAAHPDAPAPRDVRLMDHHFLMVEAAASGLGVAMSPRILAQDDIDRGRLIAPMGFHPDGTHYGLIVPAAGATPSTDTDLLVRWITHQFGEFDTA